MPGFRFLFLLSVHLSCLKEVRSDESQHSSVKIRSTSPSVEFAGTGGNCRLYMTEEHGNQLVSSCPLDGFVEEPPSPSPSPPPTPPPPKKPNCYLGPIENMNFKTEHFDPDHYGPFDDQVSCAERIIASPRANCFNSGNPTGAKMVLNVNGKCHCGNSGCCGGTDNTFSGDQYMCNPS